MSVFVNLVELATLWSACYPVVLFEPLLLFPSMPTGQGPNTRVLIVVTDPNGSSFTICVKRRKVHTWTVFQLKNAVRERFRYAKCHGDVSYVPRKFNLLYGGEVLHRKTLVRECVKLNKKIVSLSMVTRVHVSFDSDGSSLPELIYSGQSEGYDSVEEGDDEAVRRTARFHAKCTGSSGKSISAGSTFPCK